MSHLPKFSSSELSHLQPETIILSKQSFNQKFRADERIQPTSDLEAKDSFSEHLLVFFLNNLPSLKQQFGQKKYQYQVKTGDIAIVPAQVRQRWGWDGFAKTLHLRMNPEIIQNVALAKYKGNPAVELIPCFRSDAVALVHVAQALRSELHSGLWGGLYVEALVNRLVELILAYHSNLESQKKAPKGKLSKRRLNRVLEYIDTNLECSITLEHLANVVNIDKFWFAKIFQRTTGLSPHRYLVQRRTERALWLLLTTNQPLTIIARDVGFADQAHFNRHFKRIFGVTPGKIERNTKNIQEKLSKSV